MTELVLTLPHRVARRPAGAAGAPWSAHPTLRRWLDAVADGGQAWWWPPRARIGDHGLLEPGAPWRGGADAARIAAAARDPRLRPWLDFVLALDRDCATLARRHAARVRSAALTLDNGDLHAPVVAEALQWCLAPRRTRLRAQLLALRERHMRFIALFLHRLRRDRDNGCLDAHGYRGRVLTLWANPEETHNGRQRVLRVGFEQGGALAYKPRPADGEIAFLADGDTPGLFARLNALPKASGAIRLPTLRVFRGGGRARDRDAYLWQEWIPPPRGYRRMAAAHGAVRAVRLPARGARRFWHRAGTLAAVSFGLGLVDLGPGNVLCGERDGEAMMVPVDLEVCLFPTMRLEDTGLVTGERDEGRYAAGLERSAHGQLEAPPLVCMPSPGEAGTATEGLRTNARPWRRVESRSLVADPRGRLGYAAYLPAFLRGMFDAWMLVHLHRDEVLRDLRRALRGRYTRVLLRPTADYAPARDRFAAASPDVSAFSAAERAQLRRGDVPYFFRRLRVGAPLLAMAPPPSAWRAQRVAARVDGPERDHPSASMLRGEGFDLLNLGVALRDAVRYVLPDLSRMHGPVGEWSDAAAGVRLNWQGAHDGEAVFDWPGEDRRLVYEWEGSMLRLRIEVLSEPERAAADDEIEPADAVRDRLLRIDRVDHALRAPWSEGGFSDAGLQARLSAHTDAAIAWLQRVVDRHGWPGHALVGEDAAAAASRLVQHSERPRRFQDRCLELVAQAARAGDMSLRELAYLTDALRVQRGRKQRFGTKFRRRGEALVPCPIEQPGQVDARREAMGLEPLADYARRIRETFGAGAGARP